MVDTAAFSIQTVLWPARVDDLQAIRRAVFVVEQHVPEAEEWDAFDALSQHVLATAHGVPEVCIGSGRLLPDGHIGRMAVIQSWRGRGVGRALLAALLVLAHQSKLTQVVLHAQTHAIKFYEKQGFTAYGPEFMEAGIAHRKMRLTLKE